MLVPVQTSGAKPPLYLVHGLFGVMPLGRFLAQSLGPNQPLYGINANGIDGRETIAGDAKDMARAYVQEILGVQPSGPLLVGGMCAGGFVAMEMASELRARGREVGPLILLDPPPVPQGYIQRNHAIDPRNPLIASQLYQRVCARLLDHDPQDVPFPVIDRQRVHFATLAGVNTLVALCTHVPRVFDGDVTAILSLERAPGFFHPQMHWVKLLSRMPLAHVLPYPHSEFFRAARHDLARVLKFALDGATNSLSRAEPAAARIFAPA